MKQGRLRTLGALVLTAMATSFGAYSTAAQAKHATGKLAGVVRDTAGTPQMGASVELISEATGALIAKGFLTNTEGIFRGDKLPAGFYTVRVTLAGFLPTLERRVRITSNLTTVLRIEMESLFASLDQLRRAPTSTPLETDDWKWVLRTASSDRPILQWMDKDQIAAASPSLERSMARVPRARLEFTDGARRPGSVSNVAASPATAFAYDQRIGNASRMIFAGQMSYESDSPAGGFATVWLPTGSMGAGPHTALVLRQAKLGPDGATFRGIRADQGGAMALGDRVVLRYGGEYVLVGLGTSASSLRPRAEIDTRISDDWRAMAIFASQPGGSSPLESADAENGGELIAALNELDAFPALLWRDGHPVLQSGMHEEVAVERKLGTRGKVQIAAFHDDNGHVAIFGRGNNLPTGEYFQDYFSNSFAYDGGSSSSWGTRVAMQEKLDDDIEVTAVYAFGGALSPADVAEGALRDVMRTMARHSLGANVSAKIPHLNTRVNAGYKWISGTAISRVDSYGESLFQMDPYLHISVRQPLPRFSLGRWEAIVDCDNLLAQGYVPLTSRDGNVMVVPAFRSFRGGLSVQF